eukprot:CAMPEP_0115199274 /NCGR_PEP_ID=MMETSP0270-20121206/16533_1 /TAXON_ID=71861 /ORGANISM="Scrippsiella trochoidea, Strain CCMP3099" /LENGTH=83 /DNA_ID=CAMNT_0002612665 /DNA_START=107 /DNA_END=358 /DNA_ORIENTATION=-
MTPAFAIAPPTALSASSDGCMPRALMSSTNCTASVKSPLKLTAHIPAERDSCMSSSSTSSPMSAAVAERTCANSCTNCGTQLS